MNLYKLIVYDCTSLEIYLEALIIQTWRQKLIKLRIVLQDGFCASLEMHMEAAIVEM